MNVITTLQSIKIKCRLGIGYLNHLKISYDILTANINWHWSYDFAAHGVYYFSLCFIPLFVESTESLLIVLGMVQQEWPPYQSPILCMCGHNNLCNISKWNDCIEISLNFPLNVNQSIPKHEANTNVNLNSTYTL